VNDDTSLTVGGDFQFAYYDTTGSTGESSTSFIDNGSSLYFAGEQEHANGITTSFYLDLDQFGTVGGAYNDDDGDGTLTDLEDPSGLQTDEYHVSFAGDFGEVKIGNEGDVSGPVFDVVDIGDGSGVSDPAGGVGSNVVQYYSNDLNGVSFAVQAQINGDAQKNTDGSSTSFGAFVEADLGSFMLAAGYDERANSSDSDETLGIMASTSLAGVDLAANHVVEEEKNNQDTTYTGLTATYGYGAGSVYGVLNNKSIDNLGSGVRDDFNEYIVGVNYSITPNSYVYAEMSSEDKANDQGDETVVGMYYGW
jgi:hypothetical protein